MDFEFDPAKAAGNLRKHGVSFADAATGRGSAGHVLVVVYTLRGDSIRLISVRRATPAENRTYET